MPLLLRGSSKTALAATLAALTLPATAHAWKPERAASHAARPFFQDRTKLKPLQSKSTCRHTQPGESYYFPWSDDWYTCRTRVRHGGTRGVFKVYAHRGDEWGLTTDDWSLSLSATIKLP